MSNNRNNRPKEIESLKGPRRKLSLIVEDGKRYIKKRDLDHYFIQEHWTIKDFNYHFGLGHRIVRQSLYKWYTQKEIDKSHRDKIALKQEGDRNSNSINWYRPRKLIPLETLKDSIRNNLNKKSLQRDLKLTCYELSSLLQHYNYHLPEHDMMLDRVLPHLSKSQLKILKSSVEILGISRDLFENPLQVVYLLNSLSWELRIIGRKLRKFLRRELKDTNISFPSNLVEYLFGKALTQLHIGYTNQYFIRDLGIHVDFLLDDGKTILEVDGNMHDPYKDKLRDQSLYTLGYSIIRIDLEKEGLKGSNSLVKIKKCLKKYLSRV